MKLFIAVELENNVKTELEGVQEKLKDRALKGRFTSKDNFHLTLRYIGEVHPKNIDSLKNMIDQVSVNKKTFDLSLGPIGSFPKKQRHIVWAGLQGRLESLHNLYLDLEAALIKEGVKKEGRPYNPHISLGRQVKLEQTLEQVSREIKIYPLLIPVTTLSLMESTNIEGRLTYRPIYRKQLKGED